MFLQVKANPNTHSNVIVIVMYMAGNQSEHVVPLMHFSTCANLILKLLTLKMPWIRVA